ncbi:MULTISPECIES: type II toxin-antitoxin system Phd/YefM family antitoxin [unclassified Anabaena]|jgi:antitoxin YefM|uniref:type II toxin-antitoxin system Phd/YefM family antitoxin n=1 Tax=unclassified Anabaena TaxID=2619674 RepID=UPI00144748AC|nr:MULTISPECIES: type II toxin-antitoxin system prevent-host-death family antitoxin [unclassified Anabaena]MTJ09137.1 type II toxin-antitoxin system prevent-host-death family antitoxin [Anabaena sp. UHCC 0204]MTJ53915.1 type II toxin-antitoxin system prevent-host-death family antitoxin [Anabaena sp. UHCC 0253]
MKAITSNQAKHQLDELINRVILDVEPTIVCNDQGQQAVLMSLDEFNSWQETLYLLSNPANAEHLMESIKQAKSGKKSVKELIDP